MAIVHTTKVEQAREKVEELRRELREEVHDEVRSSVRQRAWRRFAMRCFGCCGVYVLALLTIVVFMAYVVARSGIVAVPVLSDRVRHEREPTRVVNAQSIVLEQRLETELQEAFASGRVAESFDVSFTEEELTGMLRGVLQSSRGETTLLASSAQVVADDETLEFFGRVDGSLEGGTTVLVRMVPRIKDDRLAFDVVSFALGNLGIPTFVARIIASRFELPTLRFDAASSFPAVVADTISIEPHRATITFRRLPEGL